MQSRETAQFLADAAYISCDNQPNPTGQNHCAEVLGWRVSKARALLGSYFHTSVPSPGQPYVVVQYQINFDQQACIVDAREYELPVIGTTIQEMTGDWFTYPRNFPTTATHAPTQNLADAIHKRRDKPVGLMAPSARNPLADNLILFEDRLPAESIAFQRVIKTGQM